MMMWNDKMSWHLLHWDGMWHRCEKAEHIMVLWHGSTQYDVEKSITWYNIIWDHQHYNKKIIYIFQMWAQFECCVQNSVLQYKRYVSGAEMLLTVSSGVMNVEAAVTEHYGL